MRGFEPKTEHSSPRRLTTGLQALVGIMLGILTILFHKNRLFSPTIKLADKNEGQQESNRRPHNTPYAGFTTGLVVLWERLSVLYF